SMPQSLEWTKRLNALLIHPWLRSRKVEYSLVLFLVVLSEEKSPSRRSPCALCLCWFFFSSSCARPPLLPPNRTHSLPRRALRLLASWRSSFFCSCSAASGEQLRRRSRSCRTSTRWPEPEHLATAGTGAQRPAPSCTSPLGWRWTAQVI